MSRMVEDTWYSVVVPILEFVHENGYQMGFVNTPRDVSSSNSSQSRSVQRGGVSTIRSVAPPGAFQINSTSSSGLATASIEKDPLPIFAASSGSVARIAA